MKAAAPQNHSNSSQHSPFSLSRALLSCVQVLGGSPSSPAGSAGTAHLADALNGTSALEPPEVLPFRSPPANSQVFFPALFI